MFEKHSISLYPVSNGDTCQIVLDNGRRLLLDFCHRDRSESLSIPDINLKARLKKELDDSDRDYFDVVAFTHADLDHIQGSTEFFELEHALKYQGNDRVKISELWVPAALLLENVDREHMSEEFVILKREARHRLLEGKGIVVFSKPKELTDWLEPKLKERGLLASSRDHLFVDAGTVVKGFTLAADGVEFFCHSPFIEHVDDEGDVIRNSASLVFNVRFQANGMQYDYLHFGDAAWEDIEKIVNTTSWHGNEDRLAWDLLNTPHHCSYKSLSDEKGDTETLPKDKVKELLLLANNEAYIACSSKPIPDNSAAYNEVQPPHIQARKAYENHLRQASGRKFLVTMEEPNTRKPEPLEFEVTSGGVTWKRSTAIGAAAIIRSAPPRAG